MAEHVVIGTAGHVDHGKTTLVKALTGVDCDRLPEEKARGITIELGFAPWDLGDGRTASLVDVPGHERFVHTMVAGTAGIDRVLLVVAADDGVMPQTREHLAICGLLGVAHGVVAITKCDRVDEDVCALVEDDVRALTRGTFLERAPVVRVAAPEGGTPRGLSDLARAMVATLDGRFSRPRHGGGAWCAVDRVFTRADSGTVVTGTLVSGEIHVGAVLDAQPTARGEVSTVRVRSLQVHGRKTSVAIAPTRVALALRGDDLSALCRGGVLSAPGLQSPTHALVAEITPVEGARRWGRATELTLHLGTAEHIVRATPVEGEPPYVVRFACKDPMVAFVGQRLVVRRPDLGDLRTVAGGIVSDPHPPRRPRAQKAPLPAPGAGQSTSAVRLRALIEEASYAGIGRASMEERVAPGSNLTSALKELTDGGVVIEAAGRFVSRSVLDEAIAAVSSTLATIHAERPLSSGASPAELETRQPMRLRRVVSAALAALLAARAVVAKDGLVCLVTHDPQANDAAARVAACFARAHLAPPRDEQIRAEAALDPGGFRDVLAVLKRRGVVTPLGAEMHVHADALAELERSVRAWLGKHAQLSPADLKALGGGLSRKHAIPLLEWLDRAGVTRRQGDVRVAGPRGRSG